MTNIDKYKNDFRKLVDEGDLLLTSMQLYCFPEEVKKQIFASIKDKKEAEKYIKELPNFKVKYQSWYSESLVVIKQLLPDRLDDFVRLFEKPKLVRKNITYENYVIEDFLQSLIVNRTGGFGKEEIVGVSAGLPKFEQQLNMLMAVEKRFESSLFDITQLIQADIFDSELESSKELNKRGFIRGAGAIVGVVLESHLLQVCKNHNIIITKSNPTISDLNDLLKKNNIIETSVWRHLQLLGDLRNKCDHKKDTEPTKENVDDLIDGTDKIIKTIF